MARGNGRSLHDPLRIGDDSIDALSRGQLEHDSRLFDIEAAIKQIAADVKDIKRSTTRTERINDALWAMQVHNAKAWLAAADLRDETRA